MLVDKFPWLLQPNIFTILIRAALALLCASIIGYERNVRGAPAGLRTHILVCIGSMLAMSTGQFAAMYYTTDIARIGAQVVSGIGFLGAGSIIVTRANKIAGLTTAAGLWATACIGLAIGIGFFEGALVGAVVVFFTEHTLRGVSHSSAKYHQDPQTNQTEKSNSNTAEK